MEISYLSWLRGRIGKDKETVDLPAGVDTVEKLVGWLSGTGGAHRNLFSHRDIINVSVNGRVVHDWGGCPIVNGDKVTFFSPMAGG